MLHDAPRQHLSRVCVSVLLWLLLLLLFFVCVFFLCVCGVPLGQAGRGGRHLCASQAGGAPAGPGRLTGSLTAWPASHRRRVTTTHSWFDLLVTPDRRLASRTRGNPCRGGGEGVKKEKKKKERIKAHIRGFSSGIGRGWPRGMTDAKGSDNPNGAHIRVSQVTFALLV